MLLFIPCQCFSVNPNFLEGISEFRSLAFRTYISDMNLLTKIRGRQYFDQTKKSISVKDGKSKLWRRAGRVRRRNPDLGTAGRGLCQIFGKIPLWAATSVVTSCQKRRRDPRRRDAPCNASTSTTTPERRHSAHPRGGLSRSNEEIAPHGMQAQRAASSEWRKRT